MSTLQPIKLYGKSGPNPPKVALILAELGVPHEIDPIGFPDLKKPEFLAINPNGRMPAIHDPNTNLTLWESGAIVEYLIERYDKDHRFSFPTGSNEAALAKQWSYFQASGQGPYYGQAVWFTKFHPEPLPSAVERYVNEIRRVTGVLESVLSKQEKGSDGPWLVGGRLSYADLVFVPWQKVAERMIGEDKLQLDQFPVVKDWIERLTAREAVGKTLAAAFAQ